MRKITREAASALLNRRAYRKANTEVAAGFLYLHGTAIAECREDGLWITVGDWNTLTTRERLNGLRGVRVSVSRGQLHLNGEPWDGRWKKIEN